VRWLNYHHLFYFWMVARKGSVSEACRDLRLSQPTISAQLKSLEEALGEKLFVRGGRSLALTEAGHLAFKYAEEIFSLGNEFLNVMEGRPVGTVPTLTIGVSDVVSKHITYRLLEPAFAFEPRTKVIVHEDRPETLLAELAVRHVDLVISDMPIPAAVKVKAFNHNLGHCGVAFLATEKLARKYSKGFPASLSGAPLLLPTDAAALRRDLEKWFADISIDPLVVGEFQDSALMKLVAAQGHGIIAVPDVVQSEVEREYRLHLVGRTNAVHERFYLISVERRIKHPAVLAICRSAASRLFGR